MHVHCCIRNKDARALSVNYPNNWSSWDRLPNLTKETKRSFDCWKEIENQLATTTVSLLFLPLVTSQQHRVSWREGRQPAKLTERWGKEVDDGAASITAEAEDGGPSGREQWLLAIHLEGSPGVGMDSEKDSPAGRYGELRVNLNCLRGGSTRPAPSL